MKNAKLESVLGISSSTPNAVATFGEKLVAYTAGSVCVLYDVTTHQQIRTLVIDGKSSSPTAFAPLLKSKGSIVNPITCIAFSPKSGRYLCSGDSGTHPRITVWNHEDSSVLQTIYGHKHGITSVCFSPNEDFIASAGFHHDGFISLWRWNTGAEAIRVSGVKVASKILRIEFDPLSKFLCSIGTRHTKFWNVAEHLSAKPRTKSKLVSVMEGQVPVMGDHKAITCIDIACTSHFLNLSAANSNEPIVESLTYGLTDAGVLVVFDNNKVLEKWVDCKMNGGACLHVYQSMGEDGYIICGGSNGVGRFFSPVTLKYLGSLPKPDALNSGQHEVSADETLIYPSIVAARGMNQYVFALYSNKHVIIWDITDFKNIQRISTQMFHRDAVWGVKSFSNILGGDKSSLPHEGFFTYGADGTVRLWDTTTLSVTLPGATIPRLSMLLNVVNETKHDLKDLSKPKNNGIKSFAIDVKSQLIACGDRVGNITIFSMNSWSIIAIIGGQHSSEVTTLCFGRIKIPNADYLILASAGGDGLVNLFDASKTQGSGSFKLVQKISDHILGVSHVAFTVDGMQLVTSGQDKESSFSYVESCRTALKSNIIHLESSLIGSTVASSQDGKISVFDNNAGTLTKFYNPTDEDDSGKFYYENLSLDRYGQLIASGGSDQSMRVIDFFTGNIVSKDFGHSGAITDVAFTVGGRSIITTSTDGCIFVWRLGKDFVSFRRDDTASTAPNTPSRSAVVSSPNLITSPFNFNFDERYLPAWARTNMVSDVPGGGSPISAGSVPKGRWAERVGETGVVLFSETSGNGPVIVSIRAMSSSTGSVKSPLLDLNTVKSALSASKEDEDLYIAPKIHLSANKSVCRSLEKLAHVSDVIESDNEDDVNEVLEKLSLETELPEKTYERARAASEPISMILLPGSHPIQPYSSPIIEAPTPKAGNSLSSLYQNDEPRISTLTELPVEFKRTPTRPRAQSLTVPSLPLPKSVGLKSKPLPSPIISKMQRNSPHGSLKGIAPRSARIVPPSPVGQFYPDIPDPSENSKSSVMALAPSPSNSDENASILSRQNVSIMNKASYSLPFNNTAGSIFEMNRSQGSNDAIAPNSPRSTRASLKSVTSINIVTLKSSEENGQKRKQLSEQHRNLFSNQNSQNTNPSLAFETKLRDFEAQAEFFVSAISILDSKHVDYNATVECFKRVQSILAPYSGSVQQDTTWLPELLERYSESLLKMTQGKLDHN